MRAAVIHTCGEPPAVIERDAPECPAGSALVAVTAAPITPLDVLCATGTSYFGAPPLPYVPGVQGVGVVQEGALAGTRVWFPTTAGMRPGDGSMARLAAVPEEELLALPAGVGDTQVAALGLSAVAAWLTLTWRAGLRAGEQVAVLGAGVVGQVAVQAAKILGARRVIALCRSETAQDRARTAGADAVVPIRPDDDVTTLAGRLAGQLDGGLDVVVDPLFGVPASAAARHLARGGRLVNLGDSAGPTAVFDSATVRSRSVSILGYTNNDVTRAQKHEALTEILRHAAEGRIAVAHDALPLGDIGAAWSRQATGDVTARVVIQLR